MARDVGYPVGLDDMPLGVDQVSPPLRLLWESLFGSSLRLVELADLPIGVGQKPEREPIVLGEGAVVLGRVERDPDDLEACFGELRGSVTEPPALQRSAGGERLGEPPERQPCAPEV